MKKIIFLSFAALFFAVAANAQSADTSANAGHKKAWHKRDNANANGDFYKKLNLSDDQKAQLKTINDDQKTKIAAINSNASLSADQKKEQIKAARTDAYNKRQAIYTPEQKAVIKEDHQKHKGRPGKKNGGLDNGAADNSGN